MMAIGASTLRYSGDVPTPPSNPQSRKANCLVSQDERGLPPQRRLEALKRIQAARAVLLVAMYESWRCCRELGVHVLPHSDLFAFQFSVSIPYKVKLNKSSNTFQVSVE